MNLRTYTKKQGWLFIRFEPTEQGLICRAESRDSGAMDFHFNKGDELDTTYTLCMDDKTLVIKVQAKLVKG